MEIKTATSFAGFLVALATWNLPATATMNSQISEAASLPPAAESTSSAQDIANTQEIDANTNINARLTRLTALLRERAERLPESAPSSGNDLTAATWLNRSGGGGFINRNPWRNGWGNGGFLNRNPWRNGGGGWINRR
jgi:rSAM-associated Gly-rich repeat protein